MTAATKPKKRWTQYDPENHPEQARKLCLLGARNKDMEKFFGVSHRTFLIWRNKHPELDAAIAAGKIEADSNMAESLYRRGMGWSHQSVKIFMPAGAKEPVYAYYTENFPPDTQAASLWLRNRKPDIWRDKQFYEHTGKGGKALVPTINVTHTHAGNKPEPAPEAE